MAEKRSMSERLADSLELPRIAFGECARIEMAGNREMVVEGCVGITEYGENTVSMSLGALTVRIAGSGLLIRSFDLQRIVINGLIACVEFT